ncbi:MAG: DUF4291 domain-containing protein [Stackebrandtia sp.]
MSGSELRQVRAVFDEDTITVYQAYPPPIATAAAREQTFVEPFSMTRMTWIKPSFLWMMYRCGWASKAGQERVLALRLSRTGFEDALRESCLSHYDPRWHSDRDAWRQQLSDSPVRIQWDPERTPHGKALPHRSLQIGIRPRAVPRFVREWIRSIEDITGTLEARRAGTTALPDERPYPLPGPIADHIGATGW